MSESQWWELADPTAEPGTLSTAVAVICEVAEDVVALLDIAVPNGDTAATERMLHEMITMLRRTDAELMLALAGNDASDRSWRLALRAAGFRIALGSTHEVLAKLALGDYLVLQL